MWNRFCRDCGNRTPKRRNPPRPSSLHKAIYSNETRLVHGRKARCLFAENLGGEAAPPGASYDPGSETQLLLRQVVQAKNATGANGCAQKDFGFAAGKRKKAAGQEDAAQAWRRLRRETSEKTYGKVLLTREFVVKPLSRTHETRGTTGAAPDRVLTKITAISALPADTPADKYAGGIILISKKKYRVSWRNVR